MPTTKHSIITAVLFMAALDANAAEVRRVPVAEIGQAYLVIGHTGEPLGTMVTLRGIVIRGGRFKGDSNEPILIVRAVNGRESDKRIEIPVRPYATDFGKPYYVLDMDIPDPKPDPERSLPPLEYGSEYEFRGYETGSFVGDPDEAAWDGGIFKQRAGFYFTSQFIVVKGRKLVPGKAEKEEGKVHGQGTDNACEK